MASNKDTLDDFKTDCVVVVVPTVPWTATSLTLNLDLPSSIDETIENDGEFTLP
jgi:hypothetical protein